MRITALIVALFLSASAMAQNYGGGPGNSGPGDKASQNEQGHGGQPDSNSGK